MEKTTWHLQPETGVLSGESTSGTTVPVTWVLESARLNFRLPVPEDLQLLFELHSDPEVMKYIRTPDANAEQTQQKLDMILNFRDQNPGLGLLQAHQKEDGSFIGWGLIKDLDGHPELWEVGYRLHARFWRQGFGTEIAKSLTTYALEEKKFKKISAVTAPTNLGSQKVLENAGYKFVKMGDFYGEKLKYYEIIRK